MVSNRAKRIEFEIKEQTDNIKQLEAAIRSAKMQLSDLQHEKDVYNSRYTARSTDNLPSIAVYKHDSRPAPPKEIATVDEFGAPIGKCDNCGRYDHVFGDLYVVNRVSERVQKQMKELEARRTKPMFNIAA